MQRNRRPKLSTRDKRALSDFLDHGERPEGTLSFHELQGFLFAIACAPELIMPSEWLPLISNDEDMCYADLREAQQILGLIMDLYNQINASVIARSDVMPSGCAFLADTAANLEEQAPVAQWSRGFIRGHGWLEDLWNDTVPDDSSEISKEFAACIMTLSFFGSRTLAEAFYREGYGRESVIDPEAFGRLADTMRRLFPSALASYADIGRSTADASRSYN